MQQPGYNTAIYCRLSREDGNEESQSIASQKEVLTKYVTDQGWNITDIYVDDGYSGTDFNRPAFKRLISDIEIGRVNIVVTKDLSRLGRNYIQTGYYTEEYFPDHNVRYIAVNDRFDTFHDEGNDFIPFKNIINEWYAKDISKKIRFTLDNQAKVGTPRNTVFPVFGYMYNEAHERIPDPELAPIVKLIFDEYLKTGSSTKVARLLKDKKIKLPKYYNAVKYGYNKEVVLALSEEELINWQPGGIRDILSNVAYIGTYVTSKHKTKSFKNHKLIENENCYVFENRYEPIIDKESFETVQRLLKRTRSGNAPIDENKYKGIVFCECCGRPLRYERKKQQGGSFYYRYFCRNPKCSESCNIQRKYLDEIIKFELISLRDCILSHEEEFIEFSKTFDTRTKVRKDDVTEELEKYMARDAELDIYIQKLFEANAMNLVPQSTFEMMINKYSKEKKELENHIKELTKLSMKNESNKEFGINALRLIEILKSLDENNILESKLMHLLIDSIKVKVTRKEGKERKYNYELNIRYVMLDSILKEFMTYESSNIC